VIGTISRKVNSIPDITTSAAANITPADTVAKQLGMLTKNDMADFYAQYIAPSSAQRSKLSVHLHAQSKTHEPALDREKSCAVAANQIELAKLAMDDTNPSLPAEPEVLSEFSNVRDSSQSVSITDIAAFKASMRLSTGVKPVRPFEEFVEDSEIY
jgi:insulysin